MQVGQKNVSPSKNDSLKFENLKQISKFWKHQAIFI